MSKDRKENAGGSSSNAGLILLGVAVVIAAAMVLYNVSGASSSGSESARQNMGASTQPPSIAALRAAAEDAPYDAVNWQELGYAHFQRGEFAEAAEAYKSAVAVEANEAVLWSALGEALVKASERDPMPPEALQAFRTAIDLDPEDARARYFLAVQQDLEEDYQGAIDSWLALLADTPPGAPWESDLVRTIEQVAAINEIDVSQRLSATLDGRVMAQATAPGLGGTTRGPSQAQIAAAGSIPPGEQRQMAEGMVAQLEARLQTDTDDLDGWVMLIRSRMMLGEPAKAREALDAAIAANPSAESGLREQARNLGVR